MLRGMTSKFRTHRVCIFSVGLSCYDWSDFQAVPMQAILFNKPRTGFNVMSASDAVGMGLELNIRYFLCACAMHPWNSRTPYS